MRNKASVAFASTTSYAGLVQMGLSSHCFVIYILVLITSRFLVGNIRVASAIIKTKYLYFLDCRLQMPLVFRRFYHVPVPIHQMDIVCVGFHSHVFS